MSIRAGKSFRPIGAFAATLACGVALLTACDFGGSPAGPTPTPVGGVTGAVTGTVPSGPTNTALPPTATPLPSATPVAAPTARRTGNTTPGLTWQLVGLTGQELFAVGGSGKAGSPVYAGGTGMYRSDDNGSTWTQLSLGNSATVDEIHVSASKPQTIYAGSGANCYGGPPGGQFRSDDGGLDWTALKEAPASIQIDSQNPERLTAMSCDGVVRSTDGGQTWMPLTDAGQARLKNFVGDEVRVPSSNGSMIYAVYVSEGGTSRIRVSTDDGKTWTGSDTDYSGLSDILVDDQKPSRAWALSQNGMLITNDSGQTWTPDVTGLDAAHNTAAGSQGAYQLSGLAAQYSNAGAVVEIYTGSFGTESQPAAGVFSSKDFGQVWTRFGGDLGGAAIHNLFVTREQGTGGDQVVLYAATDDGLHKIALGSAR
jgi:hypothetical protein